MCLHSADGALETSHDSLSHYFIALRMYITWLYKGTILVMGSMFIVSLFTLVLHCDYLFGNHDYVTLCPRAFSFFFCIVRLYCLKLSLYLFPCRCQRILDPDSIFVPRFPPDLIDWFTPVYWIPLIKSTEFLLTVKTIPTANSFRALLYVLRYTPL